MVGVVSGNGLGLFNTSLDLLGNAHGNPTSLGQAKGSAYVNIATGNLSVQFLDESLSGTGADLSALRTYNSQGGYVDGDADGWRWNGEKKVALHSGSINQTGSVLLRTTGDGTHVTYSWNGSSYVSTAGSGAHDFITWNSYNGVNEYIWRQDSTGDILERYDANTGWIKTYRDNSGNGFDYSFTGNLLTSIKDLQSGQTLELGYTNNRLSQISTRTTASGALTKQVDYFYNASGRLETVKTDLTPSDNSIADNNVYTTTYGYDANGLLSSIGQSDGTSVSFKHELVNGSYRVTEVNDQTGKTTFAYDISSRTTIVKNGNNDNWSYTYDSLGQLVSHTSSFNNGVGQKASYSYDSEGNVKTITDGRNNTITYDYDSSGNRLKEYDSLGNTISRTFDTNNRLVTETKYSVASTSSPSGTETTRYVYDTAGRLRFVVSPEGRVSETRYNSVGLVQYKLDYTLAKYDVSALSATAQLNETTLLNWVGNLTPTQRGAFQLIEYQYDYRGNLNKKIDYATVTTAGTGTLDNSATITEYTYSEHGQLLHTIAVRGGNRSTLSSYGYDGMGRQTTAVNNNATTTTIYSGLNITVTNTATGLTTVSTTDASGRLVNLTQSGSGNNRITKYYYDNAGQLRMTEDPTGARTFLFYDLAGRVNAKVDAAGAATVYTHDADGRVLTETRYANVTNPSGWFNGTAVIEAGLSIGTTGTNIIIDTANDRKTTYTYDAAGRLLTTTVDGAATITNTYDGASRLIKTQQGDRITRYFYDKDGKKIGMLDAERYLTQYVYDSAGRLTVTVRYGTTQATVDQQANSSFDGIRMYVNGGARLSTYYFYDAQGRQTGVVNEQGFLTVTAYDAVANRRETYQYATAVTVAESNSFEILETLAAVKARAGTSYWINTNYDTYGRVDTVTQQNGGVSRNVYDTAGRLVRQIDGEGDPNWRITHTRYNAYSEVTGVVTGDAAAGLSVNTDTASVNAVNTAISNNGVRYDIDGAGRKVVEYQPNGQKTFLFYNAAGQLTYTVNALGEVAKTLYNAFGQVKEVYVYSYRISTANLATITTGGLDSILTGKLPGGAWPVDIHTYTTYNKLGLVSKVDANDAVTTNTYNIYGQLETATQRISSTANTVTRFNYDLMGRIKNTIRDDGGLGATNSVIYDGFGRVRYTTDANGRITETKYNLNGREIEILDPLGRSRKTQIDAQGRTVKSYDGLGNITSYSYDDANRTFTVTSPDGVSIVTTKSIHGETLTVKDGNGGITTYAYTKDGKLDTVTNALGVMTTDNTYDNSGRLYESKDANGVTTRYTYDAANRVTQKAVDPTGLNIRTSYEFDGAGRQIRVTEGVGTPEASTTEYRYNYQNKIGYIIVDPSGLKLATQFTYDDTGNTLTVSKGVFNTTTNNITTVDQITQYVFDKLGRTQFVVDAEGAVTENIYDANGNIVRTVEYANKLPSGNALKIWHTPNTNRSASKYLGTFKAGEAVTATVQFKASPQSDGAIFLGDAGGPNPYDNDVFQNVYGNDDWKTITVTHVMTHDDDMWIYLYGDVSGTDANKYVIYDNVSVTSTQRGLVLLDDLNKISSATDYTDTNGWSFSGFSESVNVSPIVTNAQFQSLITTLANSQIDRTTNFVYDAANRLRFSVNAEGAVTENIYDANGNVIRTIQYGDDLKATKLGNVLNTNIYEGNVTPASNWYVYDSGGTGGTITKVFDNELNQNVAQLSGNGSSTGYTFATDWNNQEQTVISWDMKYSQDFVVYVAVNTNKGEIHMRYDAIPRGISIPNERYFVLGEQSWDGKWHRYTRDLVADLASVDPTAVINSVRSVYIRGTGRIANLQLTTDAKAISEKIEALKSQGSFSEANARITNFVYDKANRLKFTVNAEGAVTENIYDANGNIVRKVNYANKVPAEAALKLFYRDGTNRSASQYLGNFSKGDIVTATVRYKAPSNVSGAVFLGDAGGADPYDNDTFLSKAGDDGWRTITVSRTMTHDDSMHVYVYAFGSDNSHHVIYDNITVTSVNRGNVLTENFSNGISNWSISGYAEATQVGNILSTTLTAEFLSSLADAKQDSVSSFVYDKANRLRFSVNAEGAVSENIYDANGNVVRTINYAKKINLPTINSTDNKTLSLNGGGGWLTSNERFAVDTNKTYTITARLRQTSGQGAVYVGVQTYDASGNLIWNPHQGNFSYAAAGGVWLTPEMGWQTFTGTITGVDPVAPGASMNKFLAGTVTAAPLLLYNYYDDNSGDLSRIVELDSFELIDNATGETLNLNSSMELGTSNWGNWNGGLDSINSPVSYLSEDQFKKLLRPDAANDRTTNFVYDAANRLRFSINAENAVTETTYDALGNVKEIIQYANKLSSVAGSPTLSELTTITNRLNNAYFAEPDTSGVPASWVKSTYMDAGTFGVNLAGAENLRSGLQPQDNVFYIKQVATTTNLPGSYQELTQTVPITTGKHYAFSVSVGSKGVAPEVLIRWLDGNGNVISTDTAGSIYITNGVFLTRATVKNTAPAGAVQAQLVLRKTVGTTETYLYAARPQFEELPSLSSAATNWVKSSTLNPNLNDRKTVYEYDKAGRQTKTIMSGWYDVSDGKVYGYGGDTDRFQRTIEVTYDALGNAVANKIRVGLSDYIYQYKTYDKVGREVNDIDGMGHVTQKTYDALGNVKTVTRSASPLSVKTSGYWLNTDIATLTGRTITFDYDKVGRQIKVTQPTTGTTGYRSQEAASTNGALSAYNYSAAAVTEFVYDALGNLTKQTQLIDNAGRKAENYFYYDKLGRQIWSIDAEKYATKTLYDALGNVSSTREYATQLSSIPASVSALESTATHAKDRVNSFSYDKLGQVKTTTRSMNAINNGAVVTTTTVESKKYNAFGNLEETVDALNNITTMQYNRLGSLTKVIEPTRVVAGTTNNDVFVNQVSASPITEIKYTVFGERAEETRYGTAGSGFSITTKHIFDVAGNEIQTIDDNGTSSYSLYDVGGRVIAQKQHLYSTTYLERRFEYDKAGRQVATYDIYDAGTKKTGQVNVYNTYGEVTEERKAWGAASATTLTLMATATSNAIVNRYEYDDAGRIKLKQGSDGFIYYYYDLAGQTTRIEQRESASNTTTQRVTENYYDLLGRTTVQRLPSYTATTGFGETSTANPLPVTSFLTPKLVNSFDRWGNLLTRKDAADQITTYTYNHNNQVLSEVGPRVSTITLANTSITTTTEHQMVYDKLGRSVQDKYIARQVDAYGATIANLGTHTTTHFYNNAGQLIETIDATYDGGSYYDEFGNRITPATAGNYAGVKQQYTYDIHGNRVGSKDGIGYVKVDSFNKNGQISASYILRKSNTSETNETAEYKNGSQNATPVKVLLRSYSYDAAGRKTVERDSNNIETRYFYDERSNLTSKYVYSYYLGMLGGDTVYEYDEVGNKTAEKQRNNNAVVMYASETNYKLNGDFTDYAINLANSNTAKSYYNTSTTAGYNYTYTGFGQRKTETYFGDSTTTSTVTYDYWENGLQKSIVDVSIEPGIAYVQGSFTTTVASVYYHDIKGNRTAEKNSTTLVESSYTDVSGIVPITIAQRTTGTGDLYSYYQYDNQNRLTSFKSPNKNFKIDDIDYSTSSISSLTYQYDEWGNRRKITTSFTLPSGVSGSGTRSEWYSYDNANRVLVEAGINYSGTIGIYKDYQGKAQGVLYSYDNAGRRSSEERWSSSVAGTYVPGASYGSTVFVPGHEKYTLNVYTYNDLSLVGNIQEKIIKRATGSNSLATPTSISSGSNLETNTYNNRGFKTRAVMHQNNRTTTTTYDSHGRVVGQLTKITSSDRKASELKDYVFTWTGEVQAYTYVAFNDTATNGENFNNRYGYTYQTTIQGLQVKQISVTSSQDGTGKGTTSNRYDLRGRLVASQITEAHATNTSKTGKSYLKFVYNAAGQIIVKAENRYDDSSAYKTQNYYYSPTGGELANLGAVSGTINMSPLSAVAQGADTPGSYTINNGDTLMGISQMLFGDSKFWYLIADANGITKGPTDAFSGADVGRNLRIPNSDKNISNTSNNWKPYNPSEVIGDLTPDPTILPPKKAGCNVIAMIIMVVIAVVATVMTAGAFMAGPGQAMWAAGVSAMAGGMGLAGAAAVAVGGFVGSVLSQGAGVLMGVQDSINFRQAAASGLTAGFAAGAGQVLSGGQTAAQLAKAGQYGKIAATAATSYVGAYVSNKIVGIQTSFSWSGMAASTLTAMGSSAVSGALGMTTDNFMENFGRGMVGTGVSNATQRLFGNGSTMHGSDWGMAAADSFGNAIGNAIVEKALGGNFLGPKHGEASVREKTVQQAFQKREADKIRKGGSAALMDYLATTGGMTPEQVDAFKEDNQYLLDRMDVVRQTESELGKDFESMSLREQEWALGGGGSITVISGTGIESESRVRTEQDYLTGMVTRAAGVIESTSEGVNWMVNSLGGEDNAAAAVFGLQALIGGVPKAVLNLATGTISDGLFGEARAFATEKVGGLIAEYAFKVGNSADAEYIKSAQTLSNAIADFGISTIGDGARGVIKSSRGVGSARMEMASRHETGDYGSLQKGDVRGDRLDNHHVPQKAVAKETIPGYPQDKNANSAPAIRLGEDEHRQITRMQNQNRSARESMTPRQLLADDASMLRSIGVPNEKIIELINLNKVKYGLKK